VARVARLARSIRATALGEPATYNGGRTVRNMETTLETVGTVHVPADRAQAFGRVLLNVATIASTDPGRGAITGVHVRATGESITFTATDAYRAIRATYAAGMDCGEWETVLNAKQLAAVGANIGKAKGVPVVWSGVIERPGSVVVSVGENPVVFPVDSLGVPFPDMERIYARRDGEQWPAGDVESVGVNPDLLTGLLTAMRKIAGGKRSDVVRVNVHNVSARYPWRFTLATDHVTVESLLMPMRG